MIARSLLMAGVLFGAHSAAGVWHNHLVKSSPATDEVLAQPPTEVRLWFAEALLPEVTSIGITRNGGVLVRMDSVRRTDDPTSVAARIPEPLAPGAYEVDWKTQGDDIHDVKGTIKFTVR